MNSTDYDGFFAFNIPDYTHKPRFGKCDKREMCDVIQRDEKNHFKSTSYHLVFLDLFASIDEINAELIEKSRIAH